MPLHCPQCKKKFNWGYECDFCSSIREHREKKQTDDEYQEKEHARQLESENLKEEHRQTERADKASKAASAGAVRKRIAEIDCQQNKDALKASNEKLRIEKGLDKEKEKTKQQAYRAQAAESHREAAAIKTQQKQNEGVQKHKAEKDVEIEKEKTTQAKYHAEVAEMKTQQNESQAGVQKHRAEKDVEIAKEETAQAKYHAEAAKHQADIKRLSVDQIKVQNQLVQQEKTSQTKILSELCIKLVEKGEKLDNITKAIQVMKCFIDDSNTGRIPPKTLPKPKRNNIGP